MTQHSDDKRRERDLHEACGLASFVLSNGQQHKEDSAVIAIADALANEREHTRKLIAKWLREEGSPAMAGYDQKLADAIERGEYLP